MARDHRDLCIEAFAEELAEMTEHAHTVTHERDVYREMLQLSLEQLHQATARIVRLTLQNRERRQESMGPARHAA